MLAAETIFAALLVADDYSRDQTRRIREEAQRELHRAGVVQGAQFPAGFDHGRLMGLMIAGISTSPAGGCPVRLPIKAGHRTYAETRMGTESRRYGELKYDDKLAFNKLTDVYYSARITTRTSPRICTCRYKYLCDRCAEEYGNPCQQFCPAEVYEMVETGRREAALADQFLKLRSLQDLRHHGSRTR